MSDGTPIAKLTERLGRIEDSQHRGKSVIFELAESQVEVMLVLHEIIARLGRDTDTARRLRPEGGGGSDIARMSLGEMHLHLLKRIDRGLDIMDQVIALDTSGPSRDG